MGIGQADSVHAYPWCYYTGIETEIKRFLATLLVRETLEDIEITGSGGGGGTSVLQKKERALRYGARPMLGASGEPRKSGSTAIRLVEQKGTKATKKLPSLIKHNREGSSIVARRSPTGTRRPGILTVAEQRAWRSGPKQHVIDAPPTVTMRQANARNTPRCRQSICLMSGVDLRIALNRYLRPDLEDLGRVCNTRSASLIASSKGIFSKVEEISSSIDTISSRTLTASGSST